jgi:hypothetical protein
VNLWTRDDRGGVAVWFALASLALAGLGGGALTMARVNGTATRLQDLADGAALAAAVEGQDPAATTADITDAARRFGKSATAERSAEFDAAAMSVRIVRRSPAEVTVTLDQEVHTIMAAMVGRDSIPIRKSATAVAGAQRNTCLHVLDPAAPSALKLQGSPDLRAPDCVVQVNSAAIGALHAQGAPSAAVEAAYVVGTASPVRNWNPAPLTGQTPRPDPLQGRMPWPSITADCMRQQGNEAVLRPGAYCDGLSIGGGVELLPGVYVVQQGGVRVTGRGSRGEGVTLVLLDPAGDFDIRGGSSTSLSAPASGPWAGVAIAAKPGPAMPTSKLTGSLELNGTLYLPGQRLLLQGSPRLGGAGDTRALIVRQLTLQGSPELSLAGGHPSGVYGAVRLSR